MDQKASLRGSLYLLLGSVIWGFAFAAQRAGMDSMQPLSFNGIRNLMAGLCLIPVCAFAEKRSPSLRPASAGQKALQRRGGLLCGIFLFLASSLQQAGLVETTAGKAGFITALYVVLVPVFAWLIFRKNPGKWIWLSVLAALAGLFLLCVPAGESFSLSRGDLLVLGCAFCFVGQMGTFCSLFTETITWEGIRQALPALLYAGILSGAVGYTLQILGQRLVDPAVASLLMCMESVFSVLGGALVLGEALSSRELFGCLIMFTAVILAQLSPC